MIPTLALIMTKPNCYQLAVLLTELLTYFIIYHHIEILYKKTIRKMRLYKFIRVAFSHPPLLMKVTFLCGRASGTPILAT